MKNERKKFNITLDDATKAIVQEQANRYGLTMSGYINLCIKEKYEKDKPKGGE